VKQVFKLAWQYIVYHKFKSLILVACVFLTALLPIAMQILLGQFNQKIVSRADSTPAVIGARGSSLDLTLNAIHFKSSADGSTPTIEYAQVARLRERGAVQAIPIHAVFSAQGYSVVGTTLEYFDFRDLSLAHGTKFAVLGECVVGCRLADSLGVEVGDYIISDRDNVLNLAGQSPLRLSKAAKSFLAPTTKSSPARPSSRTSKSRHKISSHFTFMVIPTSSRSHRSLPSPRVKNRKQFSKGSTLTNRHCNSPNRPMTCAN